jgi:predicted DNA-binding antitoxin AbrB/MazE fold protein
VSTFDAVYQDGVFRPATPPDLPDGIAVRLTVVADPPVKAPLDPAAVLARIQAIDALSDPSAPIEHTVRDPVAVLARLKRIADLPEEPGGDPTITGRDHDRTLYGGPGGAR